MWRDIANAELAKHGNEGRAIRAANGVIAEQVEGRGRKKKRKTPAR